MATTTKEAAMEALKERRENPPKKIDNSSLYAGSDMYFYCHSCGRLADVKPEDYTTPPRQLCKLCQEMKDNGWLE
jgi:hypothetical protein